MTGRVGQNAECEVKYEALSYCTSATDLLINHEGQISGPVSAY